MNSFGIAPPLISFSNTKSCPGSAGLIRILHSPYWPRPPDWRMNRPWPWASFVIASRYATWGLPMLAPTLNSRTMRSVMISRWSSPMPRMIVWPVSLSVCTLKVGSSCISLPSAMPIFSWSAFVFGSMATAMTGSGKFIASRIDRVRLVADRVARLHVLQAHGRRDVAGPDLLDLLALVGVHLEEAADALASCPWSSCRRRSRRRDGPSTRGRTRAGRRRGRS